MDFRHEPLTPGRTGVRGERPKPPLVRAVRRPSNRVGKDEAQALAHSAWNHNLQEGWRPALHLGGGSDVALPSQPG